MRWISVSIEHLPDTPEDTIAQSEHLRFLSASVSTAAQQAEYSEMLWI